MRLHAKSQLYKAAGIISEEVGYCRELEVPKSCGEARHMSRKVTPGEPGKVSSCSKVAEHLRNRARKVAPGAIAWDDAGELSGLQNLLLVSVRHGCVVNIFTERVDLGAELGGTVALRHCAHAMFSDCRPRPPSSGDSHSVLVPLQGSCTARLPSPIVWRTGAAAWATFRSTSKSTWS